MQKLDISTRGPTSNQQEFEKEQKTPRRGSHQTNEFKKKSSKGPSHIIVNLQNIKVKEKLPEGK